MPKAFELDSGDEMTKDQALKYYHALHKSVFEKELSTDEKERFWRQLKKEGKVN